MKIVQFANFIVTNNSPEEGSDFPVLTLLTGDNLDEQRKQSEPAIINQTGILQSIPVKYEQVVRFYSKSKKKWSKSHGNLLDRQTLVKENFDKNVFLSIARGLKLSSWSPELSNARKIQGKFLS